MRTIDKWKGAWRKGIAAVAAIPMVFTLMTAGTAGAAEVDSSIQPATSDTNKVLDLGFDGNLTDNSAAANTVTEYKGTATYVDGVDGKAITLPRRAQPWRKPEAPAGKPVALVLVEPQQDDDRRADSDVGHGQVQRIRLVPEFQF